MAQGDIFRMTAQFAMPQGTVAQWVWHYIQSSTGDPALTTLVAAIASQLSSAWDEIDGIIDNTVQGETLELAVWDSGNQRFDTVRTEDISSIVGTADTDMLPHADAAVVKFFTNVGRSIGKKYVMGVGEPSQNASILTTAALVALALFGDVLNNTVVGGGVEVEPGNFNPTTGNFREWNTTVEALATIGSQDRRRPGTGI